MREILFRGKRKDSGKFVEGDLYHCAAGGININTHKQGQPWLGYSVIPETVGQYTGLTDRNGTKIFEGDILIYTDKDQDKSTHKVFWSDIRLAFYACYTRYPELYGYASNFNKDDIEVIGNIHDNPELLKGGSE